VSTHLSGHGCNTHSTVSTSPSLILLNHTQSDYPLSIHIKAACNEIHFCTEEEVQSAVHKWLHKQQKKELP
jgi:hypothetical protein